MKKDVVKEPEKRLTDNERADLILRSEINHWRLLEKALYIDKIAVSKRIGGLRFLAGMIKK